jgi:hypothetical protein
MCYSGEQLWEEPKKDGMVKSAFKFFKFRWIFSGVLFRVLFRGKAE